MGFAELLNVWQSCGQTRLSAGAWTTLQVCSQRRGISMFPALDLLFWFHRQSEGDMWWKE